MTDNAAFPCPAEGCEYVADSSRAMKVHHWQSHDATLDDPFICELCGTEFYDANSADRTFCSRECENESERERVTLTCDACSGEFEVIPSNASSRRFCCHECVIDYRRSTDTDAGEWSDVQPWHAVDEDETARCEMCGRCFSNQTQYDSDDRYCCRECKAEAHRVEDRPTDVDALLRELYHEEGHSHSETYRRVRAILGNGTMTLDEVRDRLLELDIFAQNYANVRALTEADPDEVLGETPDPGDDTYQDYPRYGSGGGADA